MDAAEVRARLAAFSGDLNRLGVRALSLFGSAARGQLSPDSDLDFLVDFDGAATFDRYMTVKELLEREFNRRIDLVTVRALKPAIRAQILEESVKVA